MKLPKIDHPKGLLEGQGIQGLTQGKTAGYIVHCIRGNIDHISPSAYAQFLGGAENKEARWEALTKFVKKRQPHQAIHDLDKAMNEGQPALADLLSMNEDAGKTNQETLRTNLLP